MEQSDEAFDDAREIVRVIAAFASARTRSDVATPFAVAARAGPNFVEHVFGFQEERTLEKRVARTMVQSHRARDATQKVISRCPKGHLCCKAAHAIFGTAKTRRDLRSRDFEPGFLRPRILATTQDAAVTRIPLTGRSTAEVSGLFFARH